MTAPAITGRAAALAGPRIVRFVPLGDLGNLDPICGTSYQVHNAALLIWGTLHGVDSRMMPQRRMV